MNNVEKNTIKIVAKVAPWLAPFPSAYFVAWSAIAHLTLPLPVAVIVAAIIETLGLANVHTALWAYNWNTHKRKSDPLASVTLAVALGGVYSVRTTGATMSVFGWWLLLAFPLIAEGSGLWISGGGVWGGMPRTPLSSQGRSPCPRQIPLLEAGP